MEIPLQRALGGGLESERGKKEGDIVFCSENCVASNLVVVRFIWFIFDSDRG